MSNPGKVKFMKLLEESSPQSTENIDPLTTNIITHESFQVREESKSVFLKIKNKLGVISAIGSTPYFFHQCRKMLLELEKLEREENNSRNIWRPEMEIYVYNKTEIGTTTGGKPMQWVYTEMVKRKHSKEDLESPIRMNRSMFSIQNWSDKLMNTSFLLSSVLMFELQTDKDLDDFMDLYNSFLSKCMTFSNFDVVPEVIFIYHQSPFQSHGQEYYQQSINLNVKKMISPFQFIRIINSEENNENQLENIAYCREINSIGKRITNSMKPKTINNITLTPTSLLHFIENVLATHEEANFCQIWKNTYETFIENSIQETLLMYVQKYQQLTFGKKLISLEYLDTCHLHAKNQCLKRFKEKISRLRQNQISAVNYEETKRIQVKIEEIKQDLQQKNTENILIWGKEFLNCQFLSIEKKVKSHDITTLNSLKQQILMFNQFFKKKNQTFINCSLSSYFVEFILTKIFEQLIVLIGFQNLQTLSQIKELEHKNYELESYCKENKKKSLKDQFEINKRFMEMKENVAQLQNKCQCLEKLNDRLKQETIKSTEKFEQQVKEIEEEKKVVGINLLRQKQELINLLQQKSKQNKLYQSEIQKQKLLHQQSHQNYQQLIQFYKQKEIQLREKIDETNMSSQAQIELLRKSTVKDSEDYLSVKVQNKSQLEGLYGIIDEQKRQITILQQEIQNVKTISDQKSEVSEKIYCEITQRNRYLEEKQTQYQLRISKIRRMDQEVKKLEREKTESLDLRMESQKKYLISQQRLILIQDHFNQEKQKNRLLLQEIQQVKVELEECLLDLNTSKKKNQIIMVDQWVQVDDEKKKFEIKLALDLVKELEIENNRLSRQFKQHKQIAHLF